ncbi:MAG: hypothetical protein GYA34_05610 [Chloroflexi bacterium]|nr:hypothetical protein [Chloroflexota bacterium]
MHKYSSLIAVILLSAVTLACGVQINIPVTNINTIKPVTEEINISQPETSSKIIKLTLNFGLGELNLSPGADNALVTGTAVYNIKDLKPETHIEDDKITLETGDLEIEGIPKFKDKQKNKWNLKLGVTPMDLNINAGAYEGDFELGGLSINSLTIRDGASKVILRFSEPNQTEMNDFIYETGASEVALYGLANANFSNMRMKCGAGDYTLEFSGELLRSADVTINSGMSSVKIVVPKGTSARVFFDGGLADVDIHGDWNSKENGYFLSGGEPMLTINVNMAAGSLILRN